MSGDDSRPVPGEGTLKPMETGSRKERIPILSLAEYFIGKRPFASRLVTDITRNKIGRFQDDDIKRVIQEINIRDPNLLFTLELAYATLKCKNQTTQRACITVVGAIVHRVLADEFAWQPSPIDAAEEFLGLAKLFAPLCREQETEKRSLNLLRAVAIFFHKTRGLELVGAIPAIATVAKSRVGRGDPEKIAFETILKPSMSPNGFRQFGRILERCLAEASIERSRTAKAEETILALRDEQAISASECERLGRELDAGKTAIDALTRDLNVARETSKNETIKSRHKNEETRGRLKGFLGGRLIDTLRSAKEAITVKPTPIDAVSGRLDLAIQMIEGELKWLASE